jgi:imidazolonepropionase-like amidohydrolase
MAVLAVLASGCADRNLLGSHRGDLAIESVTIVDAVQGVLPDRRVVIKGDRILWVGRTGEGGPAADRVIEGDGRFLIPGLWDAHVHFLYDRELTDAMASLFLAYGITSVRDTGGNLEELVALRESWNDGVVMAPRLFFSGPLLDGARVVYDGATSAQPELGTSTPDAASARRKVRLLHSRGADFIKIYELVSVEVFEALVDELACASNWQALLAARRDRMKTFGGGRGYTLRRELHSSQRLPAIEAYDAERCGDVLERLGTTMQVPTLRLNAFKRSKPYLDAEWKAGLARLPASVQRRWLEKVAELTAPGTEVDLRFADWSHFLVGQLAAYCVAIGAGTDTPITLAVPGESLHRELELLVESGLSPREALFAATVEPARFFSLEEEMGQVTTGMRADLVLLRANPLVEIRNTRSIEGVLTRGRWIVPGRR